LFVITDTYVFPTSEQDIALIAVAYSGILFGGGSTNSVEDRENRNLGAVAPYSGVLEAAVIWYKKFRFI